MRAIKNKKLKVQHTEIKDVHAEIRALSQIKSMNAESNYIGISKLCCDHCALAMGAFDMSTRGLHGQRAKWAVPTFLRDSPENMKIYLGDELYAIYDKLLAKTKKDALKFIADKKSNPTKEDARHGRHMYADSSDSDVEFGVSFDDEQLADDLNDFDLNDVWQIRGMKMDYEGEIEALVDIGLSLHEIFKLYSESDNKFNALSSETFLAFIKDYAKCYNDNEQDVFEKMGNIYDEYRDLFNNMLGNQDKVFEHSIDALKIEYIASCELTDDDDVDDYETNHFENACAVLQENNGWGYIEKNDSENRYGYSSSDEDSEQHFIDNNPDDFNGGDFSSLSDYSSGGEEKDDSESETNSSTNSDEESLQYADSRIPHGSTSIFSHVPNSNSVVSVTRKPIILKFD